jgi:hypothetical protein
VHISTRFFPRCCLDNAIKIARTGIIKTDDTIGEIHESRFASWATKDGRNISAVEITRVMNKKVN